MCCKIHREPNSTKTIHLSSQGVSIKKCIGNKKEGKVCKHKNHEDLCDHVKAVCPSVILSHLFINQTI